MASAEQLPVLLVDDDEALLGTMGDILELNGFSTRAAANGWDALAMLTEMEPPPAVAVVDLGLPDMDGLDLAARLRARQGRVQVVILTGNASVESAIRAVREQNCDYLVKPVQPDQLMRTLRSASDRWRLNLAEEELESSRALLETVFDASPLPIMVINADRTIRLWNRAAEKVFGWSFEEVLGRPAPMIDTPEAKREKDRVIAATLAGEVITGVEVKRTSRGGAVLDLRLSAAGLRGPGGDIEATLVIYEDITEQRRMEEGLRQTQKLDAVGRLAAGVAHDFNNLLSVISSEVDLALDDGLVIDPTRAGLRTVRRTVGRGTALTRQLLTFARQHPAEPEVVDPNDIVLDIERMLQPLIGDQITLTKDLGEGVRPIKVDHGQLDQVITNLVLNARDAMDRQGRITIATRTVVVSDEEPGRAELDPGEWTMLSVTDTGSGISEAVMSRLFEPFFTTKAAGAGTGLGLATSYGIVQRFGGTILVESEPGRGSTFSVYLPCAQEATASGEAPDGRDTPSGTETILLVEDHVDLRNVTRRMLVRLGYEVYTAGSGIEAERVLHDMGRAPNLVLCDGHLPDDDGRAIIRRLLAEMPGLKALLVSGSMDLMESGEVTVPFLAKPYTLPTLARAVRQALDEPGEPQGETATE
jgi:two-component system, cell cycle sensor histidine kinase and response regulator CckA